VTIRIILIAALAALGACNLMDEAEQKAPVVPLPKQVCTQAREAIDKLSESGGFVYAGNGEGTIEEAAWLQLDPPSREQLEQVLAYDAACSAKEPPAEQTATIRNEGGRVLSQRVIETSADLSRLDDEPAAPQ
jgi:hypothetical protein